MKNKPGLSKDADKIVWLVQQHPGRYDIETLIEKTSSFELTKEEAYNAIMDVKKRKKIKNSRPMFNLNEPATKKFLPDLCYSISDERIYPA